MPASSKTFRIFVSSTFSDLKAERNALQRYVFPRLRDLCMQHGCRFQAIDLRWGVSEEAGRDQQTVNICLREIERCRQVTPRPNFIVLLGNRYGWRPLPPQIPADEFDALKEFVTDTNLRGLLEQWYLRDDNAVPPEYWLQPRTGDYARGREGRYRWSAEVEQPLHRELTRAAAQAGLPDDVRRKYVASAVELETLEGVQGIPDAREHVFGFFREILVKENDEERPIADCLPSDEGVNSFVDLNDDGELEEEAAALLSSLKDGLRRDLPGNIDDYTARWTSDGVTTDHIGDLPGELEECLKLNEDADAPGTLCLDVWRRLSEVILNEIGQMRGADPLTSENAAHEEFRRKRTERFVGRADILDRIQSYIGGDENQPLVIHGKSGCGKTALMAKAGEVASGEWQVANEGGDVRGTAVVTRFIGATPGSTDLRSLLSDLCRVMGVTEIPQDMNDLVRTFRGRLSPSEQEGQGEQGQQPAREQARTILFLDALDQLNATDNARMLYWLPRDLKPNVRLVASVLEADRATPSDDNQQPGDRLPEDPYDIVQRDDRFLRAPVGRLDGDGEDDAVGAQLLRGWLSDEGRALQPEQEAEVLGKFGRNGMPLYLKLAFEQACRWHSYESAPSLPENTPDLIRYTLERLADPESHGKMLVSRALGYLGAAKNGLTEDELLDTLARDDEYWADFVEHARHDLPESARGEPAGEEDGDEQRKKRQLPVIIWSRLYHDMARYLTERSADATTVFSFYHRQLREVVEEEYLQPEDRLERHRRLADYFASQDYWAESLEAQRARARRLPPSPRPANIRKVVELPYHVLEVAKLVDPESNKPEAKEWDDVADLLTDWQFLEAKAEADPTGKYAAHGEEQD